MTIRERRAANKPTTPAGWEMRISSQECKDMTALHHTPYLQMGATS